MGKTVRDILVYALESLERQPFKKFRNKLNDWEIKEGFSTIPKGKLQDTDPEDMADLILRYYTDSYGMQVTLAVLEAIDEKTEAQKLRENYKKVNDCIRQNTSQGADKGEPSGCEQQAPALRGGEHFLDRHHVPLIQRMFLVAPILDDLYQNKMLSGEAYDRLRRMSPAQEQMRELLRYAEAGGDEVKDQLLKSLREHNAPLIRSLEGK
ncbi:apoptosis-associated speck-like protein containing a CARD [Engystomops pustulosus]